ncbi:MAG: TlpA family protein disulfide reductase, partial [Pyrinomonadaceae bacterium]
MSGVKSEMKKGFIGFVLLCQLLLTTIVAQLPAPKIGDVAPELNFAKTLQSNPGVANLNSLKGSVVVLEFWATWCGPCIPALKHFNQLSGKFISKPVRFIAITDEDEAVVARFMKTVPITTWIGLDNNGATFGAYRANQRPYTVVIDRGGRIAAITNPEAVTETVLNDLLADKKVDLPAKTVVPDDLEWDLAETPDGIKPLAQIIIKPSYSTFAGIMRESGHISSDGAYLQSLISVAYQISPVRTIYNLPESKNTYRVSAIAPPGREDSLFPLFQQFLVATFGLDIK